jgi:hypothetical protein
MNHIARNSLVLCGILAALTMPVSGITAMTGGGAHHGGGHGGGANYNGNMGGGSGGITGGEVRSGKGDIGHSGGHPTAMSPAAAENLIRNYMKPGSGNPYYLGTMDDGGSYFLTDILGQDGSVMDRVMIDKHTGQVRSVR